MAEEPDADGNVTKAYKITTRARISATDVYAAPDGHSGLQE